MNDDNLQSISINNLHIYQIEFGCMVGLWEEKMGPALDGPTNPYNYSIFGPILLFRSLLPIYTFLSKFYYWEFDKNHN